MVGPAIVAGIGLLLIAIVVIPFGPQKPVDSEILKALSEPYVRLVPLGRTEAEIMAGLEGAWARRSLDSDDGDWTQIDFMLPAAQDPPDRERLKFQLNVTFTEKVPYEVMLRIGERALAPMIEADKRFIANVVGDQAPAAIAWIESFVNAPTEPERATRRFGPFNVTAGAFAWPKRCWVAIERARDDAIPLAGG